jgi:ribulose-bisphosphate carboxylase large chain
VIRAVYVVRSDASRVAELARAIAVEQTVESPDALIHPDIERRFVGRLVSIEPLPDGRFAVTLDYPPEAAIAPLPQLLNLVYGNVSLLRSVRLEDLAFCDAVLGQFRGPRFGIAGLRDLLGVRGRPLLGAVIKPRGTAVEELARMAGAFALGGGDLVKDDHNFVPAGIGQFRRHVTLCQEAVASANARTGRSCLYLCNLSAPAGEIGRYAECALAAGVRGVMLAPLALGLDTVRDVADTYPLVVLAHPTFSGALFQDSGHGIDAGVLLGTLFRMAGVDISIVPAAGGRLAATREECLRVVRRLRSPLGSLSPAWAAPAGGLRLDAVPDAVAEFGEDTVLLFGGALLTHGPDLERSTSTFLDVILRHARDHAAGPSRNAV